ncbi:MAG: MBL fold metallo-hydrolase [Gammaproteobacteria bacterium]|nr:MBL fold metallo-hydrolase [Gammaproteobacteria bacterium]
MKRPPSPNGLCIGLLLAAPVFAAVDGQARLSSHKTTETEETMAKHHSSQHHLVDATAWHPEQGAMRLNGFMLMSKGTSNSYLVTSEAGDVVINTGMANQGARHRQRYEELLGRPLNVRKIIFTQHHSDHIGGWAAFADQGSETIAQRRFPELKQAFEMLLPFFGPRMMNVIPSLVQTPNPDDLPLPPAQVAFEPVLFDDSLAFAVGGRRFELIAMDSGEALDGVVVWLPGEKALFTGNLTGAIHGALPNFYTLRGDRQRSVAQFIRDMERIIELRPALLVTGHDDPIEGEDRVLAYFTKLRDTVKHIHDETVKGMNAQQSLSHLMDSIRLPEALAMEPGRSPPSWTVRAVYEEYAGWFRHERTTELYGTPASSIWPELAELAGGVDALVAAAARHLDANEPVKAMHFIEIALANDPGNRAVRKAQIAALNQLIERSRGRNFDESGWLETQIQQAQEVIDNAE